MLQRRQADNGVVIFVSPILLRAGVPHGFSTRLGGVSRPPFDTLNLGNPPGARRDDPEHVAANYAALQQAIGCRERERAYVHQMHGADVVRAERGVAFDVDRKADALVTNDPARVLAVRVADCVPVLVASDDGRWVAAIHAGWRGVVAGVIPAAVAVLREQTDRPLLAAIGPCIGVEVFEVGDEVVDAFVQTFGPVAPVVRRPHWDRPHVDLVRAVGMQLDSAGISPENVDVSDRCTFTDAELFFSHRREHGLTGRMAALIGPRDVDAETGWAAS